MSLDADLARIVTVLCLTAACGGGPQAIGGSGAAGDPAVHCSRRGNIVATASATIDVPIVALFERSAWLSGFDVPSMLVWEDGTVVYSEEHPGASLRLLQVAMTPLQVREIERRVSRRVHDAPPTTATSPNATDQPSVQIVVRDGDAWRVVEVYGLTRDLAASDVPSAAREVFAAYHELLAQRPSGGVPTPSTYPRPPRWPEDLPTYRGQVVIDRLVGCAHRRE